MPTVDDILGPAPTMPNGLPMAQAETLPAQTLPNVDEVLGPEPEGGPASGPGADHWYSRGMVGRVLHAVGQGLADGWGTGNIGLSPETTQALKDAGVFNDAQKGQHSVVRAFNEAVIRPAATALDTVMRGGEALFRGAQGAVAQGFTEAGAPLLGRDIASMPEAFMGEPGAFHAPEAPLPEIAPAAEIAHPPITPATLGVAREMNIIGKGEGGWEGTVEPEPVARGTVADAIRQEIPEQQLPGAPEPDAPPAPSVQPETAPPADIHVVARQIAPETFDEYDALTDQQIALRDQIATMQDELRANAEAQAPHAAEIADLQERLQDTTPRLAKKYQARLDALMPDYQAFLNDRDQMALLTRETPEIAGLRQQLQQIDYRMRDLSPDVTAAYQRAAEQMPPEPEPSMVEPAAAEAPAEQVQEPGTVRFYHGGAEYEGGPRWLTPDRAYAEGYAAKNGGRVFSVDIPETNPLLQKTFDDTGTGQKAPYVAFEAPEEIARNLKPVEAQREPTKAPEPAKKEPTAPPGRPLDIANDVSRQLTAAGRPSEEAEAAGQLVAAHYQTRSERFGGARGTANMLYRDEGAAIRGAIKGGRAGAAAGKAMVRDGRTTITLFQKADASTFIHETGHQWLEELLRDAAHEAAPADLKADAATVRNWLGAKEGETIPTRAHEKFARSFERYLMEGRAPTRALAGVFEKFRQWLSAIYQTVERLRAPITDDIRDVFDRLITTNPEREPVVAPELSTDSVTRETPAKLSAFTRAPKEPTRLVAFLRKLGGVRDEGGDVAQSLGGRKLPGLINNSTGVPMDEAALQAWEAGYFPEAGETRPDINALRDAIAEDLNGTPRYSDHDREAVQAFEDVRARNSEIERMAEAHNIPAGLSRTEFFDRLAEAMSLEERAREEESLAEAHETAFDEAVDEAKHFIESEGATWDADEFFNLGGPRTLAELEDAYRQEEAAGPARQGAADDEQSAAAGGPAGDSEEGLRFGGRAGGDSGRGAAEAGGRNAAASAAAGQPFGPADGRLIDRAGNIRLDNLNTPEDVSQVIRDAADAGGEFIGARRGVMSDQDVLDLADALGMDARQLSARKLGDAFNAEQVVAARKLLIQSATNVRDAMAKATSGTDADVMAYAEAKTRHMMIQEQVAGITAEAGRALRAFRELEGAKDAASLGEFLKASTGRTLFQLRQEAQAGLALETPQQLSKFIDDSKKADFWDKLIEYWVNGLISGPATHTTYAVGNALLAVWKAVPEAAVAAGVGKVRAAFGDAEAGVRAGEAAAQLYGMVKGLREGVFAAGQAAKTGLTTKLPGENLAQFALQQAPNGAIGGKLGTVARLPSRGVAMIHSFFRAIGYSQAKAALAYRMADEEGLTGAAFEQRVAELSTNPTPEIMKQAVAEATEQTLMGRGGEWTRKLAALSNERFLGVPMLKFVMPFVKIGSNIIRQTFLERSPIGAFDADIRANLLGRNGKAAQDTQIARMVVGSAVGAMTIGLAAEGLVTGSGPADPKEANVWRMTGRQPYSVRIGDTWYSYHRLGPLGMMLSVAADMYEFGHAAETETLDKIGWLAVAALSRSVLDESWMRGPSELIQAVTDWPRYGDRYVRDQISSFIPFSVGMSQIARAVDPNAREARTMLDAIRAKVPWLSETLLPRYDIWGQPIPNKDAVGLPGLSAIYESKVNNDPVNQALLRLGNFPGPVNRKVRGVTLTDEQYAEYAKTAGQMAKMRLDALVNTPGFSALPNGVQSRVITETINNARETARTLLMMQNPAIIQSAIASKKAMLRQ